VSDALQSLKESALALQDSATDLDALQAETDRLNRQTKAINVSAIQESFPSFRVKTLPQTVITGNGFEASGEAVFYGPIATFQSSEGDIDGTFTPSSSQLPPPLLPALSSTANPPFSAIPISFQTTRRTFAEWFRLGGPIMIPLFIVGIAASLIILYKFADLFLFRKKIAGLSLSSDSKAPSEFQAFVATLLEHRDESIDVQEAKAHEAIIALLPRLERGLGAIAVLGGVAPLLGLLGTVTGMITTFQTVTLAGTTDIKLLSGGISEALITTEVGLAIAIPALLIHAWLARRVQTRITELETFAERNISQC